MTGRKNIIVLAGFILAASLLSSSLTVLLLSELYGRVWIQALGQICQGIVDDLGQTPEAEQAVLAALSEYIHEPAEAEGENILQAYGYQRELAGQIMQTKLCPQMNSAYFFILAGGLLFLGTFLFLNQIHNARIKGLADYLEKVNAGGSGILLQPGEDEFSKLQDEIYKTVTALHQMRDEAVRAKNNFAENLDNIAHQIKTPVTSISLSAQMMHRDATGNDLQKKYLEQIMRQATRLAHLEEALLLLSRIDAGTLALERREVDVFTLLALAADNLHELFLNSGVAVEIPEAGEMTVCVDMEWTMEAVMNLLKNCMEHTPPGGTVYCACEQNPLYTQIRIWDTGNGFAKEDIPHLFERFYRGKNAGSGGVGIGLALSRAIIERQDGMVSAGNLPEGGACFEIRFYCH